MNDRNVPTKSLVCALKLAFWSCDFDLGVGFGLTIFLGHINLPVSTEFTGAGLALLQTTGIFGEVPEPIQKGMPPLSLAGKQGKQGLVFSLSPHAQGGSGLAWLSGTVSSRGTRLPRSERLSNMLAKLVLSNIFENSVVWAFCVFSPAKTSLLTSLLLCLLQRKAKRLQIICTFPVDGPALALSWRRMNGRQASNLAFNNRVTLAPPLISSVFPT